MSSETDRKSGDFPQQVSDKLDLANASLSDMFGYSKEFEDQLLLENQPHNADFKITSLLDESDNSDNYFIQNSDMLLRNLASSQRVCVTLQDVVPFKLPVYDESQFRVSSELHSTILEAVEQLGGIEKATPEDIVNLVNVKWLTVERVKSHLESYQHGKYFGPRSSRAFMYGNGRQ
ncbi:Homeodomain-like superfamily protein [Euphorbia peplus]|nr:Homeodomain-like superfamily protein [Euphorbia peplus]